MSTFTLEIADATHDERIDAVGAFVGRDSSGAFGLLAGHERMITVLVPGLARLRLAGGGREYLAVTGGVLHFADNRLHIATRRYLRDPDYGRISTLLKEQLAIEEQELSAVRESLHRLEGEMLRRLWTLGRDAEAMPR